MKTKNYDYIDEKGRKIREEITLSGKMHKIDVDIEQARIDKLKEVQKMLREGKMTCAQATKIINDFGRKNKMFIH